MCSNCAPNIRMLCFIVILLFGVNSMDTNMNLDKNKTLDHIQMVCDPISNTDFGRRFCFYRHHKIDAATRVTIMENSIADEKRELIFDNCTLFTLPLGMFKQFPYVRTIYAWNSQLQLIKGETFRNADELTALDLSKNHIERLTADSFALAKNLKHLDLSENQIRTMDVNTFSGLGRLSVLKLDNNKLQLIPANVFSTLPQLKTIRLNHNSIKTIPMELFTSNLLLENIYLNDNAIEWMLGEQTFQHLAYVHEFDLHNNPILNLWCCVINAESIDIRNTNARCCSIGARTKRILANDNRISYIDTSTSGGAVGSLTADMAGTGTGARESKAQLQHINLANNKLHQMTNLTHFDALTYLDLSNNKITDIGLNSFAQMHRMEYLNLRNSGLRRIYFGSFSHKINLKMLDISYNRLNYIDFRMFVSMPNLNALHLDGNNLTNMDMTEVRKVFPSLATIGIDKNNWTCDSLASVIKYLDSNHIVLSSIGSVKNRENIKGIPCTNSDSNKSTNIPSLDPNISFSAKIKGLPSTDPFFSAEQTSNVKNCENAADLMIRLMDLKFKTENAVENVHLVSEQVNDMINLMRAQAEYDNTHEILFKNDNQNENENENR